MTDTKNEILKILNETKVEGMENLVKWLETTDFFEAPSSTKFHGAFKGGLAEHSLNVYHLFLKKDTEYHLVLPERTIVICGLLHDLCKVNVYKAPGYNGAPYKFVENLPIGHAEKSIAILLRFIKLTDKELILIRWHMAMFDQSIYAGYPTQYAFENAREQNPEMMALICADVEASFLMEKRG
jgi:hypothetical protein